MRCAEGEVEDPRPEPPASYQLFRLATGGVCHQEDGFSDSHVRQAMDFVHLHHRQSHYLRDPVQDPAHLLQPEPYPLFFTVAKTGRPHEARAASRALASMAAGFTSIQGADPAPEGCVLGERRDRTGTIPD